MDPKPPAVKPSDRYWTVPCFVRDQQSGELLPDPQAISASFFELQAILTRIGGAVAIGCDRVEISPGRVETTRLVIHWQSFAPKRTEGEPADGLPEVDIPDAPPVEPSGEGEACGICGRQSPDERPDDPPCQCQAQGDAEKPVETVAVAG